MEHRFPTAYAIPVLMFGAFCLWGALEDGLPKSSDMWFLAGAGAFFVVSGMGIVYLGVRHREAERPKWEQEDRRGK